MVRPKWLLSVCLIVIVATVFMVFMKWRFVYGVDREGTRVRLSIPNGFRGAIVVSLHPNSPTPPMGADGFVRFEVPPDGRVATSSLKWFTSPTGFAVEYANKVKIRDYRGEPPPYDPVMLWPLGSMNGSICYIVGSEADYKQTLQSRELPQATVTQQP